MSVDPNEPVRVVVDSEGFMILAGKPDCKDKDGTKEIMDLIEKGYTVKTVPYSEYQKLQWVYDRPDYVSTSKTK